MEPRRKLNILFCAAEVAPFAKVGGLADVAGSLPKALAERGHDVRVVMPAYPIVVHNPRFGVAEIGDPLGVTLGDRRQEAQAFRIKGDYPVPAYLIGHDSHFAQATESRKIYSDDPEPYILFSKAVLELMKALEPEFRPDIIHTNDWHTALVPVYLKTDPAISSACAGTKAAFTIHNLAYQGEFDFDVLGLAGLPESVYDYRLLEAYGKVNLLKGGIVFSDCVNTVSQTYSQEIQTPEFGCRLDGLLKYTANLGKLRGIVNGIDYQAFDPHTDKSIPYNFGPEDWSRKSKCKETLQAELGLDLNPRAMLIGIISRMADQKGFDLIAEAAEQLFDENVQLAVLGSGEKHYEGFFAQLPIRFRGKAAVRIGHHPELAQRIYAGSDAFLMPSRFEPCGLGQMIALRYGTIPIVRETGGLKDTIAEFDSGAGAGNGFLFGPYTGAALLSAVRRAVRAFSSPADWSRLVQNAFSCDFSWASSAREYEEMYNEALGNSQEAQVA